VLAGIDLNTTTEELEKIRHKKNRIVVFQGGVLSYRLWLPRLVVARDQGSSSIVRD